MTLQDRLDAFKTEFRAARPPEVRALMERATAELVASGAAARARKAGERAPDFALDAQDGARLSSADLLAQGPLVVSFYRGVWCPYCNMELQALEAALPAFIAAGARLVAISPQNRVNSRKAVRENSLDFPILSDPGNTIADAFGLRFALPGYLIDLYKALGNNLPRFNADASWTLPMPGRYVIGSDGFIAYAEVNPDYTRRPEPTDLLPAIRRALRAVAA